MIKVKRNKNRVWITFTISKKEGIDSAQIAGSWSGWQREDMKVKKNGDFYITKILPAGEIYEFRYILNGNKWVNEEDAMEVKNSFGEMNSAIKV